ncbi:MAG: hypothetical protein AAF402_09380 [Pseudomonadota bacterium]
MTAETGKRRLLQKIMATTALAAVPAIWVKPVVNTALLPAHAQSSLTVPSGGSGGGDITGRISGSFNGGQGDWVTFRQGGSSTSSFSEIFNVTTVTLQGHLTASLVLMDSLSIVFDLNGNSAVDPSVTYLPTNGLTPFYEDNSGAGLSISLSMVNVTTETIEVAGMISGTIYRRDSFSSPLDLSDSIDFNLMFEATAYPE